MTCDAYSNLNPMKYVCEGAAAISEGLINGIKNSAKSTIDFDPDELALKVATIAKKFYQNFTKHIDLGGGELGKLLDRNFNEFWKEFDLTRKFTLVADEFNKAYSAWIKHAKIAENTKILTDEFDKLMEVLRASSFKNFDGIRADFQQIFANMARDTTLKMVPWIALGTTITVGTPFLVSYVYYKAKHNIGKPNLASEVKYIGWYNRSTELISNIISGTWQSSIEGLKYGIGAAALGSSVALTAGFVSMYKFDTKISPVEGERWLNLIKLSSLGVGATAAACKAGSLMVKKIKTSYAKQNQPVFHKELNETIANITKSTYNLQKNGGFFQNVLLYGPGGTGKTMISKYMAKNSNMNYVMMSGGDLAQYISRGEHVTELNKLFEAAKNSSTPTILFIDEAESLCRDRDHIIKPELIELQNAFLNHTGESSNKIMLIMATNRIEDLDPAVLSRMDHKLFIGPPKLNERKKIIENYLPNFFRQKEIKEFFSEDIVGTIALKTENLTGRTIFKMLNAIKGSKNASADNKLTKDLISEGVRKFVEQEAQVMNAIKMKSKAATTPAAPE